MYKGEVFAHLSIKRSTLALFRLAPVFLQLFKVVITLLLKTTLIIYRQGINWCSFLKNSPETFRSEIHFGAFFGSFALETKKVPNCPPIF